MDKTKHIPKTDFQSEEDYGSNIETVPFLWQGGFFDGKPKITRKRVFWVIEIILFLSSLLFLVLAMSMMQSRSTKSCVAKHSIWSPALHVVNEEYQIWRMSGTLRTSNSYRGPPSSEIDAAWEKLWNVSSFRLSTEGLKRMNGSEDSVSFSPEKGGGYMASLAVNHQLHCVHFLWQQTYQEYYWDDPNHDTRPSNNISGFVREHIDHCADILRQKIMCDADTGVILYNWVKGYSRPYPNFNTRRKCRNFDDVLQWAIENQETNGAILNLEKTQDSVELELPP